jgi:glycosyltransferase 2 family protein
VKLRLVVLAALGLPLTLYLLMHVGIRAVLSTAATVGWGGFATLCACSLGLFVIMGTAWRLLFPPGSGGSLGVCIWARMVRDSAAEVLPFSQIGGMALGVRAAVLRGVPVPLAAASMIADVTTEFVAQIAYAALGVAILVTRLPRTSLVASSITGSLIGLVLASIAAGLFVAVQRYSQRFAAPLAARLLPGAVGKTVALGAALEAIYRSPARVALSAALHVVEWLGSAGIAWIAFRLIGARADPVAVLAIESFVYAGRSMASFVPSGLGVQEAVYAGVAPLFGVSTEYALAVSVLKRARDIATGVPVLLLWQVAEGRHALSRSTASE